MRTMINLVSKLDHGSAVLLVLFVCLAVTVSIQALSLTVVCAQRALSDEVAGRAGLADVDRGLAGLRARALAAWGPVDWGRVGDAQATLVGRLVELDEARDWILGAEIGKGPAASREVTATLVERGRDGLDLPLSALVAARASAADGRPTPWLSEDGVDPDAAGYVGRVVGPALVGEGCRIEGLSRPWALGDGWRQLLCDGCTLGPRVVVLSGDEGEILSLPENTVVSCTEEPILVVVTGGADLDLRDCGDVWMVVVVDQGSLLLEGTRIHGALFVGGCVDFGVSGTVAFDRHVLGWATDRSLMRARLVPGTRLEGTE